MYIIVDLTASKISRRSFKVSMLSQICLWLVPCPSNWKINDIQKGMNAELISTLYSQRPTDRRNFKEPIPLGYQEM